MSSAPSSRACLEFERLLSKDDFFGLPASNERPHVEVSFVDALIETIVPA
jgi:hypothetical protein